MTFSAKFKNTTSMKNLSPFPLLVKVICENRTQQVRAKTEKRKIGIHQGKLDWCILKYICLQTTVWMHCLENVGHIKSILPLKYSIVTVRSSLY